MTRTDGGPHYLGLDVGGTKLAAGVVSADGSVRSFVRAPSRTQDGPKAMIGRLFDLGAAALADAGLERADAVGIGCGSPLDTETGVVMSPPGLPDWIEVPIGPMAAERFAAPACLDNDATAAALGEHLFGPWGVVSSLAYVTVSTGIGGGLIRDGVPYRGYTGNGLEFGHMVLDWHGRACNCGQRGCVEAYASGPSIARRAREGLAAGADSTLAAVPEVTSIEVAAAAADGDVFARAIWDETTAVLGRAVAAVINVIEPELVVLGGGVTHAGPMLIEPVRTLALQQVMSPGRNRTRIEAAAHGERVGVVGAAAVAAHRFG